MFGRFFFVWALACTIPLFPRTLYSQEQLGMRLERYSGIYSTAINPANTAFNPDPWDVSLLTVEFFFENSYAYLRNTSLPNALRNSEKLVSAADISPENPAARDAIIQDFFEGKRKMRGVAVGRISGPSFSMRLGEEHEIGFVTAFRTGISSYKIPGILEYQTISNVPLNQTVDIPRSGLQAMAWGEIGLHYSKRNTYSDIYTAFGITPRLLLGLEGVYARAQSVFDYTPRGGDTVTFGRARWDYALTTGNFTDQSDSIGLKVQGKGFGIDIGFAWAAPDDEGDTDEDYLWKIGVSLIDAGFIRFDNTAERHHIEFDTLITVTNADFPPRDDPHDILGDASRAFLGDPLASLQSRSFTIGLPTALSAQFDFKAAPKVYVAGLIVQRIPLWKYSLQRPNTLALVPRYEHRWFSVSLPLVLNDWQSFRVGLAARLGYLYLGTDQLGSFFKKKKLSGADIYIGLKNNGFDLFAGKGGRHGSSHRQKRRKIKCYY
ncbi:MAG: hypothetical protein KDC65_10025 [Saprospiraceae bacterium]|nr:hypothetical protein [Saprospiraceae bacterium]